MCNLPFLKFYGLYGICYNTASVLTFWPRGMWNLSSLTRNGTCTPCIESSVQSLSRIWLFTIPWTVARQASLSITNSQSLFKLMSIKSVMPSKHLILCHPLLLLPSIFSASGSFPKSQFFTSDGQSIGVSSSVVPMNIQDWSPLGWTGWISLQSKGLSRVFSNTTVQKQSINSLALSFL